MSFFAKKPEPQTWPSAQPAPPTPPPPAKPRYGIADAIQLMRTLPANQDGDLVIHVVRATLGSLNVRLPDIIEDAARKQKTTQERIAAVHVQIGSLEKKLEEHRKEIEMLEADLKETTEVKARLESAEKSAGQETMATIQMAGRPDLAVRV